MPPDPPPYYQDDGALLEALTNFGVGRKGSAAAFSPEYSCGLHTLWLYRMSHTRAIGFAEGTNEELHPFLVTETYFYFNRPKLLLELYNCLVRQFWRKLESPRLHHRFNSTLPDVMDQVLSANLHMFKRGDKLWSWEQYLSNPPARPQGYDDIDHLSHSMSTTSLNAPRSPMLLEYQEEAGNYDSDVQVTPHRSHTQPPAQRRRQRRTGPY